MDDTDKLQLVYTSLIEEIHRYRDWPIRILTFTSALHFGVIGAFLLKDLRVDTFTRLTLSIFLACLCMWTIYYFYRCNENYLQARDIQRKVQEKLGLYDWIALDGTKVFPKDWFSHNDSSRQKCWFKEKRFWGWGFYAFYAACLFLFSLLVIWKAVEVIGNGGAETVKNFRLALLYALDFYFSA